MSWSLLDRESPFEYIKQAISLYSHRDGKVIVNIGCIRSRFSHSISHEPKDCPSYHEGHNDAHYAATDSEYYTCDIDPKAVALAKEYTKGFPNTTVVQKDGIKFLRNFNKNVDLLSLDFIDVNLPGCAEKHLEAYKAIKRRLHDKTVVIIDDTDVSFVNGKFGPVTKGWGGKGRLLIPAMIKDGWRVIKGGRCTILTRRRVCV